MLSIQKILFPTDFSQCAESAFAHATALAKRYEAELHIVHVVIWPMMIPSYGLDTLYPAFEDGRVIDNLKQAAGEQLSAHSSRARLGSINVVEAQITDDAAGPAILSYAEDHDVDLIVMGTHGRKGIKKWMLGSVTQEIIRHARCPVFTVNPDTVGDEGLDVKRLLVPVDFSEHAEPLVRYAKSLAAAYDAGMDLLHVIAHVNLPLVYGVEAIYPGAEEVMDRSRSALLHLAQNAEGPDVDVNVVVQGGDPAHQILTYAERHDMDLIVLCTHGFTGVERLLLGSVAEKVVRAAAHPVFTIHSFGKSLLPESATDESVDR